ncbi:low molecular weight protein-tyrosine-phosphatase [Edaphocola flava]|uniref:low molecular weight protein-tyrosine-phosphatase n=1 Tax=Edaphocola flava TaxID=2499629 RepID=UPI001F27F23A|nr:low molecular weight protein-tyrosine-phosphatase [Edaphocola flava]
MKILMVCLGNICRSPIAEGVMQHIVREQGLDWQIDSAGTNNYHTGESPHRSSQKVCRQYGIDISHQRARQFRSSDFDTYDHILVMAADVYDDVSRLAPSETALQKVHFFLDSLSPGKQASVPDPWYGDESGYAPVFDLIQRGCNAWLTFFTGNTPIFNRS